MRNRAEACAISIIVPVYNGDDKIQKCLDSLLAENLSNCELIIVDNASTDLTREKLLSYQKKGVAVYSVGPPSRGLARQFGIEKAAGKIIVMLDCDCVVLPGWLRKITTPIVTGTSKIVIGKTEDAGSKSWGKLAAALEKSFLFQPNEFAQCFNFTSTHFAVERSCLKKVSFDSRFKSAEDFDFGLQCALKNIKIDYCDTAVARHYYLDDLKSQILKSLSRGYWSYLVFKKYEGFDLDFRNRIRKNKGLEYFRLPYTIAWAIGRIVKLVNFNTENRKIVFFQIFYELSWQLGVLYARFENIVKKVDKSKFLARDVLALKDL